MRRFLAFLAIGTLFSTVEEFLTVIVLKHDVPSFLFTLVALFPAFLTLVYFSSRVLDRLIRRPPVREVTHFFAYGAMGLLIEWFAIGLSPWSNPDAPPVLMLLFQLGMFSFWATVAFAPRLFLEPHALARATRRTTLRFWVPYFAVVYLVAFLVPVRLKFATVITLIVLGYLTLTVVFLRYFQRLFARDWLFSPDDTP